MVTILLILTIQANIPAGFVQVSRIRIVEGNPMRKIKYQTIAAVVLICGWMVLFVISGTAQKTSTVKSAKDFETWSIHSSAFISLREGGKSFSLNSKGDLQRRSKNIETRGTVEAADLQEITNLIQNLNLPRTRTRTVKGKKIYDYPYWSFTILLDGKSFPVEGFSFADAKFLVLTATQRKTLDQLKLKLETFKTEPARAYDNSSWHENSTELDPTEKKMVFRYEYWNNARGFQHHGWYINELGDIYKYGYDLVIDPKNPGNRKYKFKTPPTLVGRVTPEVLAEKRKLISHAANGIYSERSAANDAGESTITAFVPDAKTGKFRKIVLNKTGDYEGSNSSPKAAELVDWLKTAVPEG